MLCRVAVAAARRRVVLVPVPGAVSPPPFLMSPFQLRVPVLSSCLCCACPCPTLSARQGFDDMSTRCARSRLRLRAPSRLVHIPATVLLSCSRRLRPRCFLVSRFCSRSRHEAASRCQVLRCRESEFSDPMTEDGYDKVYPDLRKCDEFFFCVLCWPPSCASVKTVPRVPRPSSTPKPGTPRSATTTT